MIALREIDSISNGPDREVQTCLASRNHSFPNIRKRFDYLTHLESTCCSLNSGWRRISCVAKSAPHSPLLDISKCDWAPNDRARAEYIIVALSRSEFQRKSDGDSDNEELLRAEAPNRALFVRNVYMKARRTHSANKYLRVTELLSQRLSCSAGYRRKRLKKTSNSRFVRSASRNGKLFGEQQAQQTK